MTEDEQLNAQIEAELNAQIDAELEADLVRKRMEIVRRLRREAQMKEYDRINARHPIEGPGDPKAEAGRRAAMDARAKADKEWMDRVNSRPVDGIVTTTISGIVGPWERGVPHKDMTLHQSASQPAYGWSSAACRGRARKQW